jgi:hypothetical protein
MAIVIGHCAGGTCGFDRNFCDLSIARRWVLVTLKEIAKIEKWGWVSLNFREVGIENPVQFVGQGCLAQHEHKESSKSDPKSDEHPIHGRLFPSTDASASHRQLTRIQTYTHAEIEKSSSQNTEESVHSAPWIRKIMDASTDSRA